MNKFSKVFDVETDSDSLRFIYFSKRGDIPDEDKKEFDEAYKEKSRILIKKELTESSLD